MKRTLLYGKLSKNYKPKIEGMKTRDEKKKPLMVNSLENNIKVPEHQIRQRAFEIYLGRNEDEGNEATDWIQAENELNPSEDYLDSVEEESFETTDWSKIEHDLAPREEDV